MKKEIERTEQEMIDMVKEKVFGYANWTLCIESPCIRDVCRYIGVKYSQLSTLGKIQLKAHIGDTADSKFTGRWHVMDAEYYLSL